MAQAFYSFPTHWSGFDREYENKNKNDSEFIGNVVILYFQPRIPQVAAKYGDDIFWKTKLWKS